MSRSSAREGAFKLIFEYVFNKSKNIELLNDIIEEEKNKVEIGYIQEVYNGVINHYEDLIEDIQKHLDSFKLERVFKVDLAILLLATYEIKFINSIPNLVSVNEALNLAKKYSTEKSNTFINGVLSNFVGV